jgi:hypothetical protein
MWSVIWRGGLVAVLFGLMAGCDYGVPPDEALARVRREGGEFAALGPDSSADVWQRAAEHYFPPARRDYFEGMDAVGRTSRRGPIKLELDPQQVIGRNAWVMWTGGNEAWWDWLARYGYGTVDLLKLIDDRGRETRFARTGMINEPGTRLPSDKETDDAHGVHYARPITEPGRGGEVHVEYRKDRENWAPPNPEVYGVPTGVIGLRLFPNPMFDAAAERRWDDKLYYSDTAEGRRYASDPATIRPYRVGMSCGYCHIAPHPLMPPFNPEFPRWENLSNNIGNQFIRMRVAFGNSLEPDNYFYHVFDSFLPGAVDTSAHPSDNNNNPNTVNSFFGLPGRLERAAVTPLEVLSPDSLAYVGNYTEDGKANPRHLPKVLLDGSDSVGVHVALSRVYLNIGTHYQQWLRTMNPFIGFRRQRPFKLRDVRGNSLYWHAIRIRIQPMASFFMVSTDPMRLKDVQIPESDGKPDAPATRACLEKQLRGTGLPWYTAPAKNAPAEAGQSEPIVGSDKKGDYAVGRQVFVRGCIACHSSVQPGDLPELEQKLALYYEKNKPAADRKEQEPTDEQKKSPVDGKEQGHAAGDASISLLPPIVGKLPEEDWVGKRSEWDKQVGEALAGRRRLRLTIDDRVRLTRGDGKLPEAYAEWASKAVERREFWEHQGRVWDNNGDPVIDSDGRRQKRVTVQNYLSIDERIPVTVVGTNSARATATNSLHGHVWEDFASQTYKELDAVGPIRYPDPFSGATKSYSPPGGGVGYYRVPTLISVWATAPFLHNNALGTFNNNPSVPHRLAAFDDAINRLLWPDKRQRPSEQHYWPGRGVATSVADAWYVGKNASQPVSQQDSGSQPTEEAIDRAAAQRVLDSGWIWRTTQESWIKIDAPHVPMLVGGVAGLYREQMQLVAFLPTLAFLGLGIGLLLTGRLNSIWDRIDRRLTWLAWLLGPFRWLFSVGGLALALASGYFVLYRFRPAVALLDVGTGGAIPWFRLQAFLIPVLLFGSAGLLFLPFRASRNWVLAFTARVVGVACLVLAVITAMGIGRTLAGMGADVKIGPIPEGVPVNIVASIDPLASRNDLINAGDALVDFLSKHQVAAINNPGDEAAKTARRREFQEKVAPLLLRASKCPDFVIDRGHDYVFIRDFTDQEKRELIALIKTF